MTLRWAALAGRILFAASLGACTDPEENPYTPGARAVSDTTPDATLAPTQVDGGSPPTDPNHNVSDVVKPSDFVYLGAMKVPGEISGFSMGAMTGRKVNGEVSFFMVGHVLENGQVYEFPFVGSDLDIAKAPRSTVSTTWGDIYQGKKAGWTDDGAPRDFSGTYAPVGNLLWHGDRLYWSYGHRLYPGANDHCLGMTDLKGGPSTQIAHGPWRLDNTVDTLQSSHACGILMSIPDGDMGIGGGRHGPSFRKFKTPNDSSPAGLGSPMLSGTKWLEYPGESMPLMTDGSLPPGAEARRQTRDNDYSFHNTGSGPLDINPLLTPNNQGYFTHADAVTAGTWIELNDKHAVIYFGMQASGHVWEGNGGEYGADPCANGEFGTRADGYSVRWWIYDPKDLEKVANGTLKSWEVSPNL